MGTSGSTDTRSVQSIVSSSDIVVFQSSGCPYCSSAIGKLEKAGYTPTVIEASSEQRQELSSSTGSSSVPSVWLKGKYVGGCNDGPESWMGINKILQQNRMDEFLK
jgi:glutaredoxin